MAEKIEIEKLLLRKNAVLPQQLEKAKEEAKKTGLPLEKALEKLGFISEEEIANIRASALGVPYINLEDYHIDSKIINLIPEELSKKYKVVPLFKVGNSLTVAMTDPQDIIALDRIREISKADSVEAVLATARGIDKTLDFFYNTGNTVDVILDSLDKKEKGVANQEEVTAEKLEQAPAIKLVDLIIIQAAKERASDIHIEPEEDLVRVRYRVDGVLHQVRELPKKIHNYIVARIKILANLDIAESRKPQDGRIKIKLEDKNLDLRVATFPTVKGENLTIRLLDKSSLLIGLENLGFPGKVSKQFNKLIRRPYGIILVTGPTGSGKTTTLYSALTAINSIEKNIITIEDPVEYELPLIRQSMVNPKAGLDFANGLRSILRQDPDVVMVGEIRDTETAEIAIQAALTGHLVFATLHTNDAASALARLADMGVENFLIASSVIAVLAQRLVRTLCEKCKQKYTPSKEVLKDLGVCDKQKFYKNKGCKKCNDSGFTGRIGIFELMLLTEEIKEMVLEKKSTGLIKKKALGTGMEALRVDGLRKAKAGLTTLDEIIMATEIEGV